MSAVIRQMVSRKRQDEAILARREEIIAAAKGAKGDTGDTGPMPNHEWNGTKLRFEKPDGSWGRWVDLKGKDGKTGTVIVGGGGGSAQGLNGLPGGVDGVDPTQIAVMQGGQWVGLSWVSFIAIIQGALDMGSPQTRRIDFVGDTVIYQGEAAPGANESAAVWRIKKVVFGADGDVTTLWAVGVSDYNFAWDDRATLSYA